MNGLESFFSPRDWGVLGLCVGLTFVISLWLRRTDGSSGEQPRPLPWPVVGCSLVLAELTGWIFLAAPGVMLAICGNLAYVQWMIVSLAMRSVIGFLQMRRGWVFREGNTSREEWGGTGRPFHKTLAILSHFSSWIGLALRLVVLALPLALITSWPAERCLLPIVAVAALLVFLGGAGVVAKVESIHLICLGFVSVYVLASLAGGLTDGWAGSLESLRQSENFEGARTDKLAVRDFRLDPALEFTFWTALLCFPFHQWWFLAVDRGTLMRLRLCVDARAAGRAVLSSSLALIVILLLLATGLALFLDYRANPPEDPVILRALDWRGGEPARYDLALFLWILTEMPEGARGMTFGVFIAASMTGLQASLLSLPRLPRPSALTKGMSAFLWGLGAVILAIGLIRYQRSSGIGLLSLSYGLAALTVGPLLALSLLALRGKGGARPMGAMIGVILSLLLILINQTGFWKWLPDGFIEEWLVQFQPSPQGVERSSTSTSFVASAWLWPITALLTWACGWKKLPRDPLDF